MVRRLWIVFFLLFHNVLTFPKGLDCIPLIQLGGIQLGKLENSGDFDYYELELSQPHSMASFHLFGHIAQAKESISSYLSQPYIRLERNSVSTNRADWSIVCEAHSPGNEIEVTHLQNIRFDDGYRYRIAVGTDAFWGGNYALIADPVMDGCEIEIEDLDLGYDPLGHRQSLSTAFVQSDPSGIDKTRIFVGTERGYLLCSDDDTKTWRLIYPPKGIVPHGSIYGLFVDSQGIIYVSEWTSQFDVTGKKILGCLMESRDGGTTWVEAIPFMWPTGVAWRICEDRWGNVFVGEYAATWLYEDSLHYTGNIWRRINHGNQGESFEIVYANPTQYEEPLDPDSILTNTWVNNHVHFIDIDPYSGDIYATIGDGVLGRFIRSKQNGDPGTWETLERGIDAQYTSIVFTPNNLFLGMDTNYPYKKVVRWDRNSNRVTGIEPFWTTYTMDHPDSDPIPGYDRGNWFWGHYLPLSHLILIQYLPYGVDRVDHGLTQSPRLYATKTNGESWWSAMTFPPVPEQISYGFYGPKLASNVGPDGWIYVMRGTVSEQIHRGFRFRVKLNTTSHAVPQWEQFQ